MHKRAHDYPNTARTQVHSLVFAAFSAKLLSVHAAAAHYGRRHHGRALNCATCWGLRLQQGTVDHLLAVFTSFRPDVSWRLSSASVLVSWPQLGLSVISSTAASKRRMEATHMRSKKCHGAMVIVAWISVLIFTCTSKLSAFQL